jgi:diguanylate cyclase (GGDEF)-like protein/PAS domain S-box-containing protein
MIWQYLYIIVIFAATAGCIAIAIYAWKKRNHSGSRYFAGMMLAVSEWLFTSGMVSVSATPQQAIFWVSPRFFGLTVMLAFFICFTLEYTGYEKWLTRRNRVVIFAIPLVTQAIIETNFLHNWFLVEVNFSPDGILMGLDDVHYGPLFWLHTVYSYFLVLAGITLILRRAIRTFHLYRDQSLLMILGILPPLLTSVIDAFILIPGLKHPLAPLGFAFMGICFAWSMYKHRMLDIVPVARDSVIESMGDAMIVLDANNNVVDINPAARELLGAKPSSIIGQPAAKVFLPWNELVKQWQGQMFAQSEIMLDISGQKTCFDLRISPLKDGQGRPKGRIIILRDITVHKQAENQLQTMLDKVNALQAQLYEQTIRDHLTGLYNRRFLDEIMPHEIKRADREGHPLSFVMMDIDHFKALNDNYGHDAGDLLLQHLANVLLKNTRASDYAFRYGGEEFLLLLPATPTQAASQHAERCRLQLQDEGIIFAGQKINASVSIGIAAYLPGQPETAGALSAADTAMYRAKARGRNCTVIYETQD